MQSINENGVLANGRRSHPLTMVMQMVKNAAHSRLCVCDDVAVAGLHRRPRSVVCWTIELFMVVVKRFCQ